MNMDILELKEDTEVTVTAYHGTSQISFKTRVAGTLANTVLVDEICDESGNPISFAGEGIFVELVSLNSKMQPIIWRNVVIRHVEYQKKQMHRIAQTSDGKITNRRSAYRLYIGRQAQVQLGYHKKVIDVVLKDVSTSGFSFVSDEDIEYPSSDVMHATCEYDDYVISVNGPIVRKTKVENMNKFVYGCRTSGFDKTLDKFIMQKQQEIARARRNSV